MKKIFVMSILFLLAGSIYSQTGCVGIEIRNNITNSTGDFTLRCRDSCITLKADIGATGLTTNDYMVESIPFDPPYPFNTGTPIMIGQDDVWDGPTTLPFEFCFYGDLYTQACVGANGLISFDLFTQGSTCMWDYGHVAIPNTNFLYKHAIYGVFEDIHPNTSGQFTYRAVLGTHPCRTFVVNWNEVPLYPNQYSNRSTYQIVLYENTNIIDVYVLKRSCCSTTNSGDGIIGIQNRNGTMARFPAGRNLGTWTTQNEAWRFRPIGDPVYDIVWYDESMNVIGMNVDSIIVCPTRNTNYTVKMEYQSCNGDIIELDTRVNVLLDTVENLANITATYDTICHSQPTMLTATGGNRFLWSTGETTSSITVTPNIQTPYSVRTFRNNCHSDASKTIYISNPGITAQGATICTGDTATIGVLNPDLTCSYVWSDGSTGAEIRVAPTADIIYSVTSTNQRGCQSTAQAAVTVINPFSFSIAESHVCKNTVGTLTASGNFSYRWSDGSTGPVLSVRMGTQSSTFYVTASDVNGCSYSDSATIHVFPDFVVTTVGSEICKGDTGTVTASGATTYLWNNGQTGDVLTAVAFSNTTYTVTGTDTNGCPNTATGSIRVRKSPVANFMASAYKIQNDAPPVNFYDQSTGNPVAWRWDFGDGNTSLQQHPSNQYIDVGTFHVWLNIEDTYGCKDSILKQIRVIPPFSFFLPNSFSPNGDGINEIFKPEGEGALESSYEMLIFDRWGKLIFSTTTPYDGWDGTSNGKPMPMGVYVYTVKLITPEDEFKSYKGEFTLIR